MQLFYEFRLDENTSSESSALFTNFAALELLCNSLYGSVVGYALEGARTTPKRYVDQEENEVCGEFVISFQEGVLLTAKHWQSYLERYVVSSNELHTLALHVWDTIRRTPHELLVDTFLLAPQHDLFGYGEIFKRNQYPSSNTIFLSPFRASRRQELIEFIRRVQWVEVIERAKNIGSFHRATLLLAFRSAHLVKRLKLLVKYRSR
ncbi:hypothetical protein [Pseudomonas sp.]|uniref:hypothetical protein n=1 Tax=Pseudomonas sp. TaxID=306 RepID=UPI0040547407